MTMFAGLDVGAEALLNIAQADMAHPERTSLAGGRTETPCEIDVAIWPRHRGLAHSCSVPQRTAVETRIGRTEQCPRPPINLDELPTA